ncbi:MAG: Protein translocase subunit SecF [Candidatus Wolfebacteria bacterium GW2011_GWA2_42_10]|uniref:Protein-export membrane protein SecF n=1 Tax=Candidatus Wolfebacteria bacterium GW2011_GWA2_42_10 TaxID=1619004 RepID=A0A0G0XJB3_9BACT|nr:MAG: Protein translocase subunit SecF [Candidatus Wolfebacteria bacterium GW2011_GWA2_42_10]
MINIVENRKIFYAISVIFIAISVIVLALWGLQFGIDFKGGSILEINYSVLPDLNLVSDALKPLKLNDLKISLLGSNGAVLRFRETDEATHQNIVKILAAEAEKNKIQFEERRFSSIGPTIGAELKQKSIKAIIIVLLGISLYIAWAFRKVSQPISSWRYGVVTLIALFHDLIIPIGLFAYLGRFYGVEVGANFIVALLVILGFSVHDTIVVFDRIRENLKRYSQLSFMPLVSQSIRETIIRSLNTSLTVLLTLAALYVFGGESLKYFVLALMVGIFSGTYSSIFIAAPLLVTWFNILKKN